MTTSRRATAAARRPDDLIREKAITGRTFGHSPYGRSAFGAQFAKVSIDPNTRNIRVERLIGAFAGGRLMGPASLTLPACAALIADAWGRPVRYERQTDAALGQSLAGLPAPGQQEMRALFRALGDPHGAYATPRTPEAVTPTSFREFVRAELLPRLHSEG